MTTKLYPNMTAVAVMVVCSYMFICGQDARAQSNEDEAVGIGIEEVIVTARRRDESLRKIPSAVSAVTAEFLAETGAESFADYAGTVPGLLFQDLQVGKAGRGAIAVIRGVSSGLSASLFSQNTVAVYLDDIPIATFFDPETAGLERVEVLRGPQGTLYGNRSMGGAIRYITMNPDTERLHGSILTSVAQTQYAPDPSHRVSGMLNVPLVADKLALHLVGTFNGQAGFVDSDGSDPLDLVNTNYSKKGHNARDITQLRAKLLWEPTGNLDIVTSVYYEETDIEGSGYFDPEKSDFTTTALFGPDPVFRKILATNLLVEYDLGGGLLTSTSSYLEDESALTLALTGFFQPALERTAGFLAGQPIDFREPFRTDERDNAETFTQEFRLASSGDSALSYLVGLFYTKGDTVGSALAIQPGFAQYNPPFVTAFGYTGDGTDAAFDFGGAGDYSELAAFGELSLMTLDDKLQLTLGGRVFRAKSRAMNTEGIVTASAKNTDSIFRVSAAWFVSDASMLFAQISQGYRSGGGNTDIPMPPANFAASFDADTLINYELGFKSTFLDGRLQTNASIYYIDWQELQTQFTSPGGFLYGDNAGSAHTQGVELEVVAKPFANLFITASAAYLEAEIDDDVALANLAGGQRLPGTPKWTGSVNVQSRHSLSQDFSLSPGLLWTYRAKSFAGFGVNQGQELDSYSRINLYLTLANAPGSWSLTLFGDNVTNEKPVLSPFGFRTVPQFVTIRPRSWGLTFKKAF